jgi:hypothetical protein
MMSYFLRAGLVVTLISLSGLGVVNGQDKEKKLKDVPWTHAYDLACRKFDEAGFTDKTKKWGVEAYRDENLGLGIYLAQTGSIALAPHFADLRLPLQSNERPKHIVGLDLPTRKAGVKEFTKDTKVQCMEAFRDPVTDNWLFITDQGNIAATTGKLFPGVDTKKPKWVHSVDLQVRKGGVKEWKDAAKIGIEVYSDGNTGNLVYVTEHGNIAIIPETKEIPEGKGKAPEWLHGLDLSCRKFDEKSFNNARKFGVEVYHDVTTGNLVFISETGSIAVAPAPAGVKAPTPAAKTPQWTHGLNLRARQFGEKTFSDQTRTFGVEVFIDANVGVTIYITEQGNISVPSAK